MLIRSLVTAVLLALTLDGGVALEYGRVGVKVEKLTGRIVRVYAKSPADSAGLKKGDVVLESDDHKGPDHIDGVSGTTAKLKIRRGKSEFFIFVIRVPKNSINYGKDAKLG